MLAETIRRTAEPPIPLAREWAARWRGAGPALDLTQAVPGYPPHPELLARIGRAAASPEAAQYGPIQGDAALREALAADVSRAYGARVTGDEVAITAGCNLAFAMAMKAVAAPSDNVLLPAPWYFNHQMALTMQGVEARALPCRAEHGFVPSAAEAEALCDARTRAVVLVSPNNPTGAVYPPEVLAGFLDLCERRGLLLVLDETYRDFLDGEPHALFRHEGWRERLVQLYSFSKAYCVPGHRVGAIVAGALFQEQLAKALDTLQICPARPAQSALAWGVEGLRAWRAGNRRVMAERAAACRAALAGLNGWRLDALGAYFAYLRLPEGAPDAMEAAPLLAERGGLLCLPGPFFGPGQQRHLRLAFANAPAERLRELPGRLAAL
jgi:aspartate/methionine/tyrosine aminotransferase